MKNRYFLISMGIRNGTSDCAISYYGFPSRAYIELYVKETFGQDLKSIRNIVEFKTKSDYDSYLSGKTTNEAPQVKPLPNVDYDKFVALFNNNCGNIKKITVLSNERKKKVNSLITEFSKEKVAEIIMSLKKYPFIQGENKQGWVASFDWLITKSNFIKVMEGNFEKINIKKEIIEV